MTATSTYLLDHLPVEADRLVFMADLLAPEVRASCARAGLGPGGRAVDVGCGPLGSLGVLSEIVGPEGEVVGIDASPDALRTAAEVLDHLGATNARLVAADVNAMDLDEVGGAETFDLAFSRLTLMHQPDPAATVARIANLLRPGGSLIAFDLLRPPLVDPPCTALERAWELIVDGMRHVGAHPDTSRRYPELVASAGLDIVAQRGVFFPIPASATIGETTTLLRAATASLARVDLASEVEINGLIDDMHAQQGNMTFATTPFAIELMARKPS